jgi:hypothetical protein
MRSPPARAYPEDLPASAARGRLGDLTEIHRRILNRSLVEIRLRSKTGGFRGDHSAADRRDFLVQSFAVAMVRDTTAGARNEEGDGYRTAPVNFRAPAHALGTTRETIRYIEIASVGAEITSPAGLEIPCGRRT